MTHETFAAVDPQLLLGSFQTTLWLPRYRPAAAGPWTIRVVAMAAARGYWGEVYEIAGAPILMARREQSADSWMSMLPSEIESQEIGLHAARGHTVVFGLGMGWLTGNLALRTEVDQVTVVERDGDVIDLVRATGVFDQLPADARAKITIIQADALEWRPREPVDTLQADIWLTLLEDGKLDAARRMHDNVGARAMYFWGQEMEIWRAACRRAGAVPSSLDWPTIRAIVDDDLRLPLLLPDWSDYPDKIVSAARWWAPPEWGAWCAEVCE
jgi:hypothetical protein